MSEQKEKLIEVHNLMKYFPVKKKNIFQREQQFVHAVESVTFSINRGETLGVVGESGCGKSTLGRSMIRLVEPTSGEIVYNGKTIYDSYLKKQVNMKPYRREMQIIFQDPSASLDPRMTVGEIVGEALDIHKLYSSKADRREQINRLLDEVGLNTEHANRFPHEFSGGQQQRIGIARALAVRPKFIVCDEPISALDVSIQSQIINLMQELKEKEDLTYLFIAHDLSVVKFISDRILVMYLGTVVELAESNELCNHPIHPYSQTLLSAVPLPDPEKNKTRQRILLEGDIPSPINPPSGCRFHTRCPFATPQCSQMVPELKEYSPGHYAACLLLDKQQPGKVDLKKES